MLKGQICDLGLDGRFCRVLGLDNIHAGSKLALAKIWREEFPNHRALFIGDTDHDVETAEALGAECVLVCRGHQSKEYLSTLGVPVLDDLSTIIDIIKA
jgi:phosphoglycolate phosphatase-like HAD superfamily hydrolase